MADDKKVIHKANADKIFDAPLKECIADYAWNARSLGDAVNVETTRKLEGAKEDGEGPDGSRGIPGLIESIKTRGQDDPVLLRPNPDPKTAGRYPYALVAGFKRFTAISHMAALPEDHPYGGSPFGAAGDWRKNPTVRAVLEDMSELEAVRSNANENMARQDLTPQDRVFAAARLARMGQSANSIASDWGMAQGYTNMLCKIGMSCKESILKTWRANVNGASGVPVKTMYDIARGAADKQVEAWEHAVEKLKTKGPKTGGSNAWIDPAKASARNVGVMLGRLHTAEAIDGDSLTDDVESIIRMCVRFKAEATDGQVSSICKALVAGYKEGLEYDEKEAAKAAAEEKAKAEKEAAKAKADKARADADKAQAAAKKNSDARA